MKRSASLWLLCVALALPAARSAPPAHPNILLLITDQQSADALSASLGTRWLNTPHMDSLVHRGTSFSRAYSADPICMPSRTSMFTGRYPQQTGIMDNDRAQLDPNSFPTLGTVFRRAGYVTGYVGKWHVPIPITNPACGFEFTSNIKNNGSDAHTPPGVADFLARHGRDPTPFLLVASIVNPHDICEWARGDPLPEGNMTPPPPPAQCPPAPANLAPMQDEPDAIAYARRSYQAGKQFPVGGFDADRWRQYRWAYYRLIEKADRELGEVLDELARAGHRDDTVVVFTSDHGDCQGAHGWNQKTVFYEESSRVPFVIAGPGVAAGAVSDRLVQTGIDLIPTLCDFAGIAKPDALPGLSQRAPAAGDRSPDLRAYIVSCNHLNQGVPLADEHVQPSGRMLRSQRYKYCVYDYGTRRESLVDLASDPGEQVNLAGRKDYAAVLESHRAMLREWSAAQGDRFVGVP